jgi:UDP-glucose 4-epimerase
MSKSLVTGGSGFIGSHVVENLLSKGHEVICIDNESANNDNFYWNSETYNVKADISTYRDMREHFDGIDYVFHLAAESRLQPAIENPVNAVIKNCVGTTVVLQCAREAGVKRVVYSSTSSGYGNNPYPNVETQPDDCLNPYSVSKIAAEKICKMYYDLYGLETVSLRYFNVFGERSPQKGQHAPVIGIFQRQKESGQPITLVGDGSQRRDFVYVKDVAEANYLAAVSDLGNHIGEVFNVGSGRNYSVKQIADCISDNQVFLPSRSGEMDFTFANIDKIQKVLGWKPKVDVIEWING